MRFLMIGFVLVLIGCTRLPNTDEASLVDIFSSMAIKQDQILIHRVDEHVDCMVMIDARDKDAIVIHIIESYVNASRSLIITPAWIYDTDTMHKTSNPWDVTDADDFKTMMMSYTDYYDAVIRDATPLTTLALSLHNTSFYKTGNGVVLRGIDPSQSRAMDENAMVEIYYQGNTLQAVGYRLEKDFPSTKQQSNFIEGTHVTYGETLDIELPSRDDFIEAPE